MFSRFGGKAISVDNDRQILDALEKSQAIIEFQPDGTIVRANANFLGAMGYELNEIVGQHHRMFVRPDEAASPEYTRFWDELRHGQHQTAEFFRLGKDNKPIWIQASYNPVTDKSGRVIKVIKFATDITDRKLNDLLTAGKIEAISRSQAVIEFEPDGTIITANANFCTAMGYALEDIVGKHHSMFMPADEASSTKYSQFWSDLRGGQFFNQEFCRKNKAGEDIWIYGSYNPITNEDGQVVRVIKFASDITAEVNQRTQRETALTQINDEIAGIAASATQSANSATGMAQTSEETGSAVQSIAAGIEELAASSSEIAEQMERTTIITRNAVEKAETSRGIVGSLSESAQAISEVVALISGIAEQTNLLALNATIEAARAGDAGRGFAVVASEVKQLANQASQATEQIAQQIGAIQGNTNRAVDAISDIGNSITEIDSVSSSVAGAVEEQNSVTNDLSSNMQQVASSVNVIIDGIREIASASNAIDSATANLKEASTALAG